MSGNRSGGLKAVATVKAKYGEDHYKRMGKLGGAASNTGGFAADRELARTAGSKGGKNRWKGHKSVKLESASWKNNQSSKPSNSGTKTYRTKDETCRNCLKTRVIYKHGTCQGCWTKLSPEAKALVQESNDRDNQVFGLNDDAPLWAQIDDSPEFIIDRQPSVLERLFSRRRWR